MPCKNVPIIRRVKNHPTKKRHVQVQIISCFHHKFRRLNPVYIKHIFQTEHWLQSSIVEMFHDVYLNIQRFTLKRFKILISDIISDIFTEKRVSFLFNYSWIFITREQKDTKIIKPLNFTSSLFWKGFSNSCWTWTFKSN